MKLCIDPGHGMGNRKPGVYDPGCVHAGREESIIVLQWSFALEDACKKLGIETLLTRRDNSTPCSLTSRVLRAREAFCTHFISIHVNDADGAPHGVETLYKRSDDFALGIHVQVIEGLGLRDRGIKYRPDLAVLNFPGPCCMLELGFISSEADMRQVTSRAVQESVTERIAATLK